MRSLMFGVSGLKSHQTKMDVIGNNLSNVNTVGFKAGRVTFSELFAQTQASAGKPGNGVGGTNAKQIGNGMSVETVDHILTDGSLMSTGVNTDLALSGNGFFVIKQGNETYYTRNGAFTFDANGNYTLPGIGGYVNGWPAINGVIDTSVPPGKINVKPGQSMPPSSTQTITYKNSLDVNVPVITKMAINDSFDNKFSISPTDTNSYAVGDTINANVNNVSITFSNGLTILNPTVAYKYNTSYKSVILVTLGDGTTVAATAGDGSVSYQAWQPISGTIKDMSINTNIGFITPANSTSTIYDKNNTSNLNLISIVGGPTPSIINPGDYDYLLSDGSTLTTNNATYVIGANLDDPTNSGTASAVYFINVYGHLSDGAAFLNANSSCSMGKPLTSIPTNVSVVMQDANGYLETLSTTDKITPTSPVQVKSITLDTDMGDIVVSKDDTTTYTAGSTYTANIESLDINYSDNTFEKVTTEGNSYAIGQGKPVVTTVTIYDSLGGGHEIPIYFEKLPNSDEWKMVLGTTKITEANGTTLTLSLNDVKIKFAPNGKIAPGTSTGVLNVTYDNGAAPQTTMLDVEKLTLAAMPSTVTADTDGYTAGVCTKVTIDSSGVITAIYTNGEKRPEGQVSIAQFSNPSGLTQVKNGFFQVSNDSGIPVVGTATDLSVSITPGALEMSNVDVASEFSDMITSHRGFASNSKLITASDDMLEQLNNLIR